MHEIDLELVTTDELIGEIIKRHDCSVFAGLAVTTDNQDGTGDNEAHYYWRGCSLTCAGMTAELQRKILEKRSETCESEPWRPENE